MKNQDQNITFYLRHRVRLLQLLSELRLGKLDGLDPLNETLVNLEKRRLVLRQHLEDLETNYSQYLVIKDDESVKLPLLELRLARVENKVGAINRFKADLDLINKLVSDEFQQDFIKISKSKIQDLFKLENSEEYLLIFRKGELIDSKQELYRFNKIEFDKNLKELNELLTMEKQTCDSLKLKIENDRQLWIEKQRVFTGLTI